MSDEEIAFCGEIARAASVMGIRITRPNPDTDGWRYYMFSDPLTGVLIKCLSAKDDRLAFKNLCDQFCDYLNGG